MGPAEVTTIISLAEKGGLYLYSVVVTLAAAALWRRLNNVLDKLTEYTDQSAREAREMHGKSLQSSAAMQLTIQANTQAISALEKAMERRQ